MRKAHILGRRFLAAIVLLLMASAAPVSFSAAKNMAVVIASGNKLTEVSLADLAKFCKGSLKAWPDGKNFILVMKSPDSPEMKVAMQKLFGASPEEVKMAIAKLNDAKQTVKIVDSDDEILRVVGTTPGAIGFLDVYSINSDIKVLRVDGKLPFDVGYVFKGN